MIEILQPGLATSVQGPRAWRKAHLGIPLGGPADGRSHANANRLAGNPDDACALEMTLVGATLLFHAPTRIALCGAPFEANIQFNESIHVEAAQTVVIKGTPLGARCYLAVAGGIELPPGTAITKGQFLRIKTSTATASPTLLSLTPLSSPATLRYTSLHSQADLTYTVTNHVSRRGIRLAGPALPGKSEIITEGVNAGAIQVPPDGQPLILFYDQTTTGGYPKLGTLIRADLPRVGQLRPRDQVILRAISYEAAAQINEALD